MLNDNETTRDYLNFRIVASPVAQMILKSGDEPISIGVSGNWGAGKSSMVRMIGDAIRETEHANKYIFLEFNAWLYQGYEDARMALLQQVSDRLEEVAAERKSCVEKVKDFVARVNWLRVAAAAAPVASKALLGGMVAGPIGAVIGSVEGLIAKAGKTKAEDVQGLVDSCSEALPLLQGFIKERGAKSVPKEIVALRSLFESILVDLDMKLIVFVDDLDRCLPDTAISTLEAMRLLLFTARTVFILAADEAMIRRAVRARYGDDGMDEDRVASYFDKLIQIPIRVPRPASNEIKSYLVLMLAEMRVQEGKISQEEFNAGYLNLMALIKKSWAGRLTKKAIFAAFGDAAKKIVGDIDIADQIADVMIASPNIAGNPRLIKRFLNNLILRNAVASSQEMALVFEVLVKMHLFERCAPKGAFDELAGMVANSDDGRVAILAKCEECASKGEEIVDVPEKWKGDFFSQWIDMEPKLGDVDLRPYIYLSQEDKKRFLVVNNLSPEASQALTMVLGVKVLTNPVVEMVRKLELDEVDLIFDKIVNRVRSQQYEMTSLLKLLHIPKAHPSYGSKYVEVLNGMPASKRNVALVPLLVGEEWAVEMLEKWKNDSLTPGKTKVAIEVVRKAGV